MFRMYCFMNPKFQSAVWAYISSRRCLHLCQVGILLMVIFGLYVSTFYYALDNDKMIPPQELFNDSIGFTETAILLNTESSNNVVQKQVTTQIYERPILFNETVTVVQFLRIGKILSNCGLPKPCGSEEFAVHLYSGVDHKDEPRICVDGKYVLTKSINNGGRGINVVVIDNLMKMVTQIAHIDTYEKDSSLLETLLLTLRPGDIVILMTFDEPSRKLSRIARLLLFELGSSLVQNLSYRGSWYLITQKGLSGFSPYEDLHFVQGNGWPKYHDVRFCIPFKIQGQVIHPDPPATNNLQRVEFCEKFDHLPLFCDADVVNDPLVPSAVWKQPSAVNKIYTVPIIVMSGKNSEYLPLTLETLIRQPGIKPSLIAVYHLPNNNMVQSLCDLFNVMSEELFESSNYCEHVADSFERTNLLFPEAKEILFIGENAVLAPDFMFYMGQLLSILNLDQSILAVSALNENGFKAVSGDPTLVYRSESFSAVAILVKRNFFKDTWCSNNSSYPLYISSKIAGDVLVPDVSRVTLAAPSSYVNSSDDLSYVFFSHDRTITYEQNIALLYPEKLFVEDYDKDLEMLISLAAPLEFDEESLLLCLKDNEKFQEKIYQDLPHFISNSTNYSQQAIAIYFFQEDEKDISTVKYLTQCLGLFYHPSQPVRGMYKGVLRFILQDNQTFLIGSKSPFFHFNSQSAPVLLFNHNLHRLVYIDL